MSSRVLIVEDDPISQDLIKALCETRGFSVDVAADGFLGLKLLSESCYRIVFVDYHLPEMDGYALARLMRQVGAHGRESVRLIGMTADRNGLAARRGADSLFETILTKPIHPATLFATLERFSNPIDPQAVSLDATPAVAPTPNAERAMDAAGALWRRCGLGGRPRVMVHPAPSPEEAAAIGYCFEQARPAEAELVLVLNAEGLAGLGTTRQVSETLLLPSVDLSGGLYPWCDAMFRVDDIASWSDVAHTVRRFAMQRRRLSTHVLPFDPADRLLTLMFVANRELLLRRTPGNEAACDYVTGLSEGGLLAAVAKLSRSEDVVCTFGDGRIDVRISRDGIERLTAAGGASRRTGARSDDRAHSVRASEDQGTRPFGYRRGTEGDGCPIPGGKLPSLDPLDFVGVRPDDGFPVESDAPPTGPTFQVPLGKAGPSTLNLAKLADFIELVGHEQTLCLLAQLTSHLQTSFERVEGLADPLGREVHSLISMTGMLGCDRLAQACSSLDELTSLNGSFAAHLADLWRVRDETIAAIGEFRAELDYKAAVEPRSAMARA